MGVERPSHAAFGSGLALLAAAALPPEPDQLSQTQLQTTSQLPQQQAGAIRLLELDFSTLTPQLVTPPAARLHVASELPGSISTSQEFRDALLVSGAAGLSIEVETEIWI